MDVEAGEAGRVDVSVTKRGEGRGETDGEVRRGGEEAGLTPGQLRFGPCETVLAAGQTLTSRDGPAESGAARNLTAAARRRRLDWYR